MITPDELQNEVIIIAHHVEDALKYLGEGKHDAVEGSLEDINEVVERLKKFLPSEEVSEIDRIAGEVEPTL
jgi:hypothetical protein